MGSRSSSSSSITTFHDNAHGLKLEWPRIWIIILGILLIFFTFAIAGMEIGHTVYDFRRSTAFGGFILFIPLLACSILVLLTAWKPTTIFLRISTILCVIVVLLCMVLIAYDILVLVDPTRCFFLNCNDATVNASTSNSIVIVSGWPITVAWPNFFLINMIAKRIFQSIQILCTVLFMLFCILYIATYFLYQRMSLYSKPIRTYETDPMSPVYYSQDTRPTYVRRVPKY